MDSYNNKISYFHKHPNGLKEIKEILNVWEKNLLYTHKERKLY